MTIEEGLVAFVAANCPAAGGQLLPRIPKNPSFPLHTYQRISGPRDHSHSGPSGLANPRFQINTYARKLTQAKAAAEELRRAMDGYKGLMGAVDVQECFLATDRFDYDPVLLLWRYISDFRIRHREV